MKQRLLFLSNAYLPPVFWAAGIFFLSAQSALPSFDVSFYDFLFKKCSHMFVYGVLYALLFRAINYKSMSNWLTPFFITFCYAALDEVHQSFTPNRSPTLRDVGFDILGSAIAFLKIHDYI